VQDGSYGHSCYRASPAWEQTAGLGLFEEGISVTLLAESFGYSLEQNEDCLFLDVITPISVYDGVEKGVTGKLGGAPVIVWFYGGGFTSGSKTSFSSPIGLLERSKDPVTGEPAIFVAFNYRVSSILRITQFGVQS
jgi:carboxylesterase type B